MEEENKTNRTGAGVNTGMARRVRTPIFEKDIISPGIGIDEVLTMTYFENEQALNDACRYISWLEKHHLDKLIARALYKINGNKAIGYRAVKHGVMAHGQLYWDAEASKEDKKNLARMQDKRRDDDDDNGKNSRG